MEIKEFQERSTEMIEKIDAKMNREHGADLTMIHLVEELGEVARIVYNDRTKRAAVSKDALSGEFADSMMLLSHLATIYGVDIEKAFESKVSELKTRFDL